MSVTQEPVSSDNTKKNSVKSCGKCETMEKKLDSILDFMDQTRIFMKTNSETQAGLARQCQAVAEQQQWMAETVKNTIETLPSMFNGGGGLMGKLMGGFKS